MQARLPGGAPAVCRQMKPLFRLVLGLMLAVSSFAQKESFDVILCTVPAGWKQQQHEGGFQLSIADSKTGGYAMAVITRATASEAPARENFNRQWDRMVRGVVSAAGEPAMAEPALSNGWEIVSGSGHYTDRGAQGMVVLLTATARGQTVSAVLMANTQQFQDDLLALLESLELKAPADRSDPPGATPAPAGNSAALVGLWVDYHNESSGRFANGMTMFTGGYTRREYRFMADGTYVFRAKDWLVVQKEIFFAQESGTWTANGNRLTLVPDQGRGEWWSKAASGKTNEWGRPARVSEWKLETVTYAFELRHFAGTNETHLMLEPSRPTGREGGSGSPASQRSYRPRATGQSLIDNPPGVPGGS